MRLSSLKLSGFKSFADSTTLNFKANRTAVVGPNGCGKSNVIDAIRWVMGESSARQLRGGSMQDVIFTGTSKRKPVGVASVELRFDNTYGKLGGAYNAYNELAVRRQVTREGKSEYFLNGTRCRRRDITDIFLGTGLGPRSYAVIEQGMINRLVDAKPEEMRVFIEEAAGVSRYQARRRETLQHLEHTEQNLARLEDIAAELKSQLRTLKRQSEAAIQYKTLESQIRTLKIEILSFQANQSQKLQQEYTVEMTTLGEQFKLVRSESHTIEHDLEATSALFQRLIQQSSPLQQEWQQAEKKLAELKMTLEQKQSLFQQNSSSLVQLEQQKLQTKERLQLSELQVETLTTQFDEENEQLLELEQQTQAAEQNFTDVQAQQKQAQQQFEQLKTQVEKQQQQKLQMAAQIEQLSKNVLRIEQQKQTLQTQSSQIRAQVQDDEQVQLEQLQQQLQHEIVELETKIEQLQQDVQSQQDQQQLNKADVQSLKTEIQVLLAEQKNLNQLVAKQSPKQNQDIVRLMQNLRLTAQGKTHAAIIEKFLAKWLQAQLVENGQSFQEGVARQLKSSQQQNIQIKHLACLSAWIETPQSSLWANVAVAENLATALRHQVDLNQAQSILTLDGYHVGADWVIGLHYDEESQIAQGMLSHQVRLEEIEQQLAQKQPQLLDLENQFSQQQQNVQQQQHSLQQQQQSLKQKQKELQQLDVQIAKLQSTAQAFVLQQQQLADQLKQLDVQLEEDAMQRDDLEIDLHALALKLEAVLPNYKTLQFQVENLNEQLDEQQQQLTQQQQQRENLRRQTSQANQQIELLEKDISFLKTQYRQIIEQIEQAKKFVDPIQLELPNLESQFQEQFQQTEKLQKTWNEWQLELNQVQEKQQQLTEQRHQAQQKDEQVREQLEQKRLAWQAAKSDREHYLEQLKELNAEALSELTIEIRDHQQKLEKAQQQFEKIGAVNLAASQEYEEVSQRFDELSHQMQDLQNTVDQLKDAMKSIDQETRKLFMTTFDKVNQELQLLFPKVFNGGEATLSLEDDWQSGVKLMARPPGKRNSSLALLSGGEKALTALALVFAIFRLNPAPFCVLDEVDAPLDDANVQRYCNLVKELSEQVQFIYITHNKLAMTMATDLLGVTMPEPGTSKLVTVDLEQAKEYGLVAES
ncbi:MULTISPECIES: chromosome segregation protein SMC [unclassified Acinetobacter]|uniref:chromosome segregation protein SMC n=1 Tax=unclassified Acinetobacter TaxID=196816 RepID=UPI00244D56B1|nr:MULTISPECIES: chromosome segregation protein SMC [unclassified Acinetobacter]MDH0030796.1 chromosome segregation protein SMC [Acinetobacter sp. GD04021]MDH0886431.1 chromosome segregation protein SMC [Acinetobacter sp. GD03873]MDH1082819.1 chromosome segregation protein SMC [Acinetobacter sp. GD03983]MDH2189845.1 chromosome segregation protein SMC [Acinetobacter sp. GD03645]MDH2202998.1 chromosome segregation protein SMC [Acinetobacter sp. GD03647]